MRAFGRLWDELLRTRYGVEDPKHRRFRYGVQVNSLGLTEAQPENNVIRIVLETLGVTLSKDARARALQLPGLERGARPAAAVGSAVVAADPADPRLRDRPARVRRHLRGLGRRRAPGRRAGERPRRRRSTGSRRMGGAVAAVESGYMKAPARRQRTRERRRRIETGEDVVVGRQQVHHHRAEPADRRPRDRHPDRRPGDRGGRDRGGTRVAGRPRRRAGRRGAAGAARRREDRREPDGRDPRLRPGRRDDRGVGRRAARGVRRVPRAHRRLGAVGRIAASGSAGEEIAEVRELVTPHRRGARPPAEDPGRQARPGRAQQRRRADRRPRPRRRLRGHLPGHPADPGADRQRGGAGGRARRRPVDPVRLAPGAGPGRSCAG